jgi:excisionase family DNA binding protein
MTISEAARAWGVHRDTVKSWIKVGKVDATKDNGGV